MDLTSFRRAVDSRPDIITPLNGELEALYGHVGLPVTAALRRQDVTEALYAKIVDAFTSGHSSVWRRCKQLREELIQRHVIDAEALDPYHSVIDHLMDALRGKGGGEIQGDWTAAIKHAVDSVRVWDFTNNAVREKVYSRAYEVAHAAKRLMAQGFALARADGFMSLEPVSETMLVARLEALTSAIGGINVARQIFARITPLYDAVQERYHLVRRPQSTGQGRPEVPFAFLLLLAAKHPSRSGSVIATEAKWLDLCRLATDYAALIDVQGYEHTLIPNLDAVALIPYLRELALYDTLFRIPQIRASDVPVIARGILAGHDFSRKHGSGWSLDDALTVIEVILTRSHQMRGPVSFELRTIAKACPRIPKEIIAALLQEALCHPPQGANRHFSKPTDAPTGGTGGQQTGHDFYFRPLLSVDQKTFWLLDRSMCAAACLEMLMAVLRAQDKDFDGRLGPSIEVFVHDQFHRHQVPTLTGNYVVDGEHGECDIVIETVDTIIFLEVKKKPLTRRAQAGSDAHILIDLSKSLVEAQVQAGWHEVRLRRQGYLDLDHKGKVTRLELKGRGLERIAVSLLQFGSFQDRILLKQVLEATLNAEFSVNDPAMRKAFDGFNSLLAEMRQQVQLLHEGETELQQPFFHCWFLSVPQLLVLLDGVQSTEEFRKALWATRHVSTGSSDFYFDHHRMKELSVGSPG